MTSFPIFDVVSTKAFALQIRRRDPKREVTVKGIWIRLGFFCQFRIVFQLIGALATAVWVINKTIGFGKRSFGGPNSGQDCAVAV